MQKEVHVTTSSKELIIEGLEAFQQLAKFAVEEDKMDSNIILGFVAGYQAGLEKLGVPQKDSIEIGLEMGKIIHSLLEDGCGECDACKRKAKSCKK